MKDIELVQFLIKYKYKLNVDVERASTEANDASAKLSELDAEQTMLNARRKAVGETYANAERRFVTALKAQARSFGYNLIIGLEEYDTPS